jgi:predicted ATPase
LAETAKGSLIGSLAREGGLQSTLWAGPETITREMLTGQLPVHATMRKHPVRLLLGFSSDDCCYTIDLGLAAPSESAFALDPIIKRECVWRGSIMRPSTLWTERCDIYCF